MLIIKVLNEGTGTHHSANYKYTVSINKDIIAFGDLKGHDRDDGWKELITQLVEGEKKRDT